MKMTLYLYCNGCKLNHWVCSSLQADHFWQITSVEKTIQNGQCFKWIALYSIVGVKSFDSVDSVWHENLWLNQTRREIKRNEAHGYVFTLIMLYDVLNPSWPNDTIWRKGSWSIMVHVMVCCLCGAKPLPEPQITCCQLYPWELSFAKFSIIIPIFSVEEMDWKYGRKCRPFCSGLYVLWYVQNQFVAQNMLSLIARFMGPTWGSSGADRIPVVPMLATRTLLSGLLSSLLHLFAESVTNTIFHLLRNKVAK